MLQKLIMVIVSLVTMVASSVVPTGWFTEEPAALESSSVVDERITTLGHMPGKEFARVSVLWVEVDGERVTEDAWGQGHLDTLRFKVGIKRAEGNALKLGDRTIVLAPTDVFTIRGFDGRYSFADLATGSATVSLDGNVKNTLVNAAGAGGTVATTGTSKNARGAGPERLAYVDLDTGMPLGTLEVDTGGAKKLTTVGAAGAPTESGATSLDVRWVKLDDELVTSYTYGDGEMPRISFAPDTRFKSHIDFSGTGLAFQEGDRVEVRDFLGAWSVAMRPGGGARLRLDGWAASADVLPGSTTMNTDPELAFSYTPAAPSTRDIVHFTADARDRDGTVTMYEWTFLRKLPEDATAVSFQDLQTATFNGPVAEHRFTRPGTWEVALRVVDDQGGATTVTQDISVANTEPVVAFDWFPSSPVSLEQVRFFDRSSDLDGGIRSRRWDFGDGRTSVDAEPTHVYAKNGVYTVNLTVTDVNGGTDTRSKLVAVRNAAPDCSFILDPPQPLSNEVVSLVDRSSDREGPLTAWQWTIRNLVNASVPVQQYSVQNPTYTFTRADVYRVELRVTDVEAETATCAQDIGIGNKAPIVDFTVWPPNPRTGQFTYLNSTSTDNDGRIVVYNWTIEGDPEVKHGSRIGYTFRRADSFDVVLEVTDNRGQLSGAIRTVLVENSPPIADFVFTPATPTTGQEITFTNASRDPDGDRVDGIEWDFGAGEVPRTATGNVVRHTFATNGIHEVTMRATDSGGRTSSVTKQVLVANRLPTGTASFSQPAVVGEVVTFSVEASDPDGTVVGYQWLFGDGGTADGRTVTHTFAETGRYQVKVVLTDDDDGKHEVPLTVDVTQPGPIADFTVNPGVAAVGRPTLFTDQSTSRGTALATWDWDFGDGTPRSKLRNASHTYTRAGSFTVKLTVTDAQGTTASATRVLTSTQPPVAAFSMTPSTVDSGGVVRFTDLSTDDGGIVSRAWTVDGVEESGVPVWERPFTGRGEHVVVLTVVDTHGISSSKTDRVTVRNQKPVADFVAETSSILRNQAASFRSTSSDPDGYIASYKWYVFDNEVASGEMFTYTFATAQNVPVRLVVTDDAGVSSSIERQIPVFADRPITYSVAVRYADGSVAPLNGIGVQITDSQSKVVYTVGSGIDADAASGLFTFTRGVGTWLVGTPYRLVVTGGETTTTVTFNTVQADLAVPATGMRVVHVQPISRTFASPVLAVDDGAVEGGFGTLAGLLDLPVPAEPGVFYPSQYERFHGRISGSWSVAPGPAKGAFVELWAYRNATRGVGVDPTTSAAGCPAALCSRFTGTLGVDGSLAFTMPYMTSSTGSGVDLNPAGWYTIEARVSWPNPIQGASVTPVRTSVSVFVDAEGLLQRLLGTSLP